MTKVMTNASAHVFRYKTKVEPSSRDLSRMGRNVSRIVMMAVVLVLSAAFAPAATAAPAATGNGAGYQTVGRSESATCSPDRDAWGGTDGLTMTMYRMCVDHDLGMIHISTWDTKYKLDDQWYPANAENPTYLSVDGRLTHEGASAGSFTATAEYHESHGEFYYVYEGHGFSCPLVATIQITLTGPHYDGERGPLRLASAAAQLPIC